VVGKVTRLWVRGEARKFGGYKQGREMYCEGTVLRGKLWGDGIIREKKV